MGKLNKRLLIHEVQYRPVLWREEDVNFRKKYITGKMWLEVASACGLSTGKQAKMKWKSLKDQFRKEVRKLKTTSQAASSFTRVSKWQYFGQMEFIKEYIVPDTNFEQNSTAFGDQRFQKVDVVRSTNSSPEIIDITPSSLGPSFSGPRSLGPPLSAPISHVPSSSGPRSVAPSFSGARSFSEQRPAGPSSVSPRSLGPSFNEQSSFGPSFSGPSSRGSSFSGLEAEMSYPQRITKEVMQTDAISEASGYAAISVPPKRKCDPNLSFFKSLLPCMSVFTPLESLKVRSDIQQVVQTHYSDKIKGQLTVSTPHCVALESGSLLNIHNATATVAIVSSSPIPSQSVSHKQQSDASVSGRRSDTPDINTPGFEPATSTEILLDPPGQSVESQQTPQEVNTDESGSVRKIQNADTDVSPSRGEPSSNEIKVLRFIGGSILPLPTESTSNAHSETTDCGDEVCVKNEIDEGSLNETLVASSASASERSESRNSNSTEYEIAENPQSTQMDNCGIKIEEASDVDATGGNGENQNPDSIGQNSQLISADNHVRVQSGFPVLNSHQHAVASGSCEINLKYPVIKIRRVDSGFKLF